MDLPPSQSSLSTPVPPPPLLPPAFATPPHPTPSVTTPTIISTPTPDSLIVISVRGRKRHKCVICSNIAKSRCPFNCCKGCCVKAKNPCHIHVLKPNIAAEAAQGFSATPSPHSPATPSVTRHPNLSDSLRLRTLKPTGLITRKEATAINHLRFQKLKSYTEGNVEAEDEAFDRYMQNASLLETIFAGDLQNLEGISPAGQLVVENLMGIEQSGDGSISALAAGLHVRQRTNVKKREAYRQKLRRLIDRSLQKLNKGDQTDGLLESDIGLIDVHRDKKRIKVHSTEGKERLRKIDVFNSITEKVKQIENPEDYRSCLKTFAENFCNKNMISKLAREMAADDKHTGAALNNRGGSQEVSVNDKNSDVFGLGSFIKTRMDSYGVLKGWWKVEAVSENLEFYRNMPCTGLEIL